MSVLRQLRLLAARKALFLHIQKTAGSSIVAMARKYYGGSGVCSHGDFLGDGAVSRKPFISGHFGFEYARPLMDGRYTFTFLRDPVDRLLSLYRFCRAQPADEFRIYDLAQRFTLEEFVEFARDPERPCLDVLSPEDQAGYHETVWDHQAWQLAYGWGGPRAGARPAHSRMFTPSQIVGMAKDNLEAFDYVGFLETFDADARRILRELGFFPPAQAVRNNVSGDGPRRAGLPAATLSLLEEATRLDSEVYHHALDRHARREARARPSLPRRVLGLIGGGLSQ